MSVTHATLATGVDGPRLRLMLGLADSVAEKGYAATTIADIVAHARVSKRTFYEHFIDKEDCLLVMYEHVCDRFLEVLREAAAQPCEPWRERVRATVFTYLSVMEAMPAAYRTLMVDIQAAGPRAFALRKRMQLRCAEVLRELVEQGRVTEPEVRPLSPAVAVAIVGGINELLLHALDPYAEVRLDTGDPEHPFTGLTEAVTELVSAVLAYHAPGPAM
ncbi:MAG TPA: TetR/AcrR family transcriptional regulator [Pilimelia sp.]|nr:TetR/AcrR family transcriptional regulator [Pilimelia sp.]